MCVCVCMYVCINIYIVVSQLFSVVRHAGSFKLESKPG